MGGPTFRHAGVSRRAQVTLGVGKRCGRDGTAWEGGRMGQGVVAHLRWAIRCGRWVGEVAGHRWIVGGAKWEAKFCQVGHERRDAGAWVR